MVKIIAEFWPVLIPVIAYTIWYTVFKKERAEEEPIPKWEEKLWLIVLATTILIAVGYVLFFAATVEENKGDYVPAEYKDGKLVPGYIIPENKGK